MFLLFIYCPTQTVPVPPLQFQSLPYSSCLSHTVSVPPNSFSPSLIVPVSNIQFLSHSHNSLPFPPVPPIQFLSLSYSSCSSHSVPVPLIQFMTSCPLPLLMYCTVRHTCSLSLPNSSRLFFSSSSYRLPSVEFPSIKLLSLPHSSCPSHTVPVLPT